jgi:meiotic recombination protein SPO11
LARKKTTKTKSVQTTLGEHEESAEEKGTKKKDAGKKTTRRKKKMAPKEKSAKKKKSKKAKDVDLSQLKEIPGVGPKLASRLAESGYSSIEKISKAKPTTLAKKVEGLGKKGASDLVEDAKKISRKITKPKDLGFDKLPGVGETLETRLYVAGYDSIEKISKASASKLAKEIEGLGKKGASDLLSEAKKHVKKQQVKKKKLPKDLNLRHLSGVGKKLETRLFDAGYDSIEKISKASPSKLSSEIEGLGEKGAKDLVADAKKKTPTETNAPKKRTEKVVPSVKLTSIPGIGSKTAASLRNAGYDSLQKIAESDPKDIAKEVDGVGKKGAQKLVKVVADIIPELETIAEPVSGETRRRKRRKSTRRAMKRFEVKRTKSGLPVPKKIKEVTQEMRAHWKEIDKREEEGELVDEDLPDTMEVVALSGEETKEELANVAIEVLNEALTTGRPAFEIPSRSSDNIVWDEFRDLLLLGMKTISRPYHSLGSVVDATRTARLMEIVYRLLDENLHATKREVFYSDVNLFRDQRYSDKLIEDVASMLHTTRDSIHVVASARGSALGRVTIRDGGDLIDLTKMGTGGWSITPFLDQVEIVESDAEFIIVSEKDAAVMRLAEAKYWNRQPCIVITGKGSGDIATRAFLKMLVRELEIPAFALMDSDPYGHYIYSVFLRGSKRLSYESPFIATPELKLLGVLSRDLDRFEIPKSVRIPMEDSDIKRVKEMLKEPFVQKNKEWVKDLELMLKIREKAEIQAFASHSFKYLTDEYLPTKLETGDWI